MSGRFLYTPEQISFLKRERERMTLKKLTKEFNKTFGLNKSSDSIRRCCKYHGLDIGHKSPTSFVPVGTEKVCQTGYILVKTAERTPKGSALWKPKQVYLWEQAHGPLPKGYYVTFSDRNRHNFSLDNLIIVEHSVFYMLNGCGLRSSDVEITKAGIACAKLICAVKEKERGL